MDYQDLLAKQGVGSAHPGGFAATIDFLKDVSFLPGSKILEVGCGTGRTACYLAGQGYDVTALDIRPAMLRKARFRAQRQRVFVRWVEGDACDLPFPANQFDILLLESVTVFVDAKRALPEYRRVLRPGGRLYDREMMANKLLPRPVKRAISELYGVKQVPTQKEWLKLLVNADFETTGVWKPVAVPGDFVKAGSFDYPDPFQQVDEDVYRDPDVKKMFERNLRLMSRCAKYLSYGVLLGRKNGRS